MTHIGILLFDECDLLDVGGPYEVFLAANRLALRDGKDSLFKVTTVSLDGQPVISYGGMGLVPHLAVSAEHDFDVVVIPGAVAINEVSARPDVQLAVETMCQKAGIVSSVCTGAFLLGDLGLLAGKEWTTHFEDIDDLGQRIGSDRAKKLVRWVDAGSVVTSGGLSSGIAMALHLVGRVVDRSLAEATARQLDYDWKWAIEG